MGFGRARNRRRVDVTARARALRQTAAGLGRWVRRCVLVLGACAALAAAGSFGWQWALTSASFGLQAISFSGLSHIDEGELAKLAGVSVGQNVLRLDTAAVAKAMGAHPWVKSVSLRRRFPPALQVTVEEHAPAAVASLGDLYLLDEDGRPFKKVHADDSLDLPLITGLDREQYVSQPEASAEKLARAVALVRAYEGSALSKAAPLSEVRIEPQGFVWVTGDEEVRLGAEDVPGAVERLERVRAELSRRGLQAQVIHLDNRARPGWVAVKVSAPTSERTAATAK